MNKNIDFKITLLNTVKIISSICLFGMFIVVILGVIFRYLMAYPAFWTDELARFIMFYMVMLGSVIAIRENRHPGLTFIVQSFSKKVQSFFFYLIHIMILFVLVILAIKGYSMFVEGIIMKSAALRISYAWVFIGLPIASLLMIVEIFIKIILNSKKEKEDIVKEYEDIDKELL